MRFTIILLIVSYQLNAQLPSKLKNYMVSEVNKVRAEGCYCGQKYMPPAPPIKWHSTLYKSALSHAQEMSQYNFFNHYSIQGLDIGDRLEKFNYNWQYAGENLGENQSNFDEVLIDWQKSPSHCEMLMHHGMVHMAVARYKNYWVQHFGKPLPKNSRIISKSYSERP